MELLNVLFQKSVKFNLHLTLLSLVKEVLGNIKRK